MKAKKVFNIVIASLIGACAIAYLTCYCVIPERTMDFTYGLRDFFTQPIPVIGVSLGFIAVILFKLFRESSFGKKQIILLNEKHEETKEIVENSIKTLYEYKNVVESELNAKEQEIQELKATIIELGNKIPNKKVQEFVKELEYEREKTTNTETTEK